MSIAVSKEYEIILLIDPDLPAGEVESFVEAYKNDFLKGATITFEDHWGKRTLAYPIAKKTQAYYCVLHAELDPNTLKSLDEEMNIAPQIIRHLVVLWPKDAPKMTLKEIEEWNEIHLAELQSPKKTASEAKHAPRTNRKQPARQQKTDSSPENKDTSVVSEKEVVEANLSQIL